MNNFFQGQFHPVADSRIIQRKVAAELTTANGFIRNVRYSQRISVLEESKDLPFFDSLVPFVQNSNNRHPSLFHPPNLPKNWQGSQQS